MNIYVSTEVLGLYLTVLGFITIAFSTMIFVSYINDKRERKRNEANLLAEAVGFATMGRGRQWLDHVRKSQYDTMH